MEQKKILWVVLSMSAFFAIIFGVAVYLYAPSRTQSIAISPESYPDVRQGTDSNIVDPDMWTRNPDSIPSFTANEPDTNIISGNITNITVVNGEAAMIDERALDVTDLANEEKTEKVSGELPEELAKQFSIPKTSKKNDTSAEESPKKQKPAKAVEPQTVQKKVERNYSENTRNIIVERKKPVKQTSKSKPKPANPPKTKPSNAGKTAETLYWVQTASLTSRLNAEKARDKLTARQMKVEIFTKETPAGLTHRVRVGPFRNNIEAEYWLKNIKEIKGFEKSFVWQEKIK